MRLLFMSAILFAFGLILTGCYAARNWIRSLVGHERLPDTLVSLGDCLQNHL